MADVAVLYWPNVALACIVVTTQKMISRQGSFLRRSKAVVLFLLTFCLLLLPLRESVIFLCFVVRYFMPILDL